MTQASAKPHSDMKQATIAHTSTHALKNFHLVSSALHCTRRSSAASFPQCQQPRNDTEAEWLLHRPNAMQSLFFLILFGKITRVKYCLRPNQLGNEPNPPAPCSLPGVLWQV